MSVRRGVIAGVIVPWYSLEPNKCEKLVSILLLRRYPNGRRRRPSRGDGGIDVIVPVTDSVAVYDIYQIKYFHQTLTVAQRSQVRKSAATLLGYVRENGINVREWHLALPLDPTEGDEQWLGSMFEGTGIVALWKGESHLEGWAAMFPEVVDYYVHGGRERHDRLVSSALSLAGLRIGNSNIGLDIGSTYEASAALFEQINNYDPHYHYDLHIACGEIIDTSAVPTSAVMSYFRQATDGPLLRIDVLPRYNGAEEDSPILGEINVTISRDQHELADAIRNFQIFGEPVSIPAEHARVSLTGPLDSLDDASAEVCILPTPPMSTVRVRLVLREPDGTHVRTAFFRVVGISEGPSGQGYVARLVSDSGLIEFEHRANSKAEDEAKAVKGTFHLHWTESVATLVRDDMLFAREVRSPRRVFLAHEVTGPYTELVNLDGVEGSLVPEWLSVYTECLVVAQQYCNVPLRLRKPDAELSLVRDAVKLANFVAGAPAFQSKPAWAISTSDVDSLCAEVNQNGQFSVTSHFAPELLGIIFEVPDVTFSATDVIASPAVIDGVQCAMLTGRHGLVTVTAQHRR